jgi:hypothetical protein
MVFKDRVAKYPGRWTMVKEDGTSEVVTLVRNDEPSVEGTPINASTLNELSTVAGALNAAAEAKENAAQSSASAKAAASSQTAAKASEMESAKNLQGTKEYFEQVRTITIGAQGWYATPEALKTAVPVGENGWWAVVGTTDTIWTWDSDTGAWKNSIQKTDLSDYYTREQVNRLLEAQKLANYPVGSIYQSTDPTSPAALFGGSWEEIASERVLMGASSTHAAGTTVKAGLPNIKFSFTAATIGSGKAGTDYLTTGYKSSDFNLDASKSNAIYGRSSTVQPAAYYVHIWHRVA